MPSPLQANSSGRLHPRAWSALRPSLNRTSPSWRGFSMHTLRRYSGVDCLTPLFSPLPAGLRCALCARSRAGTSPHRVDAEAISYFGNLVGSPGHCGGPAASRAATLPGGGPVPAGGIKKTPPERKHPLTRDRLRLCCRGLVESLSAFGPLGGGRGLHGQVLVGPGDATPSISS